MAQSYDGVDDGLDIPSKTGVDDWTIFAIVNPTTNVDGRTALAFDNFPDTPRTACIYQPFSTIGGGESLAFMQIRSVGGGLLRGAAALSTGTDHTIIMTRDTVNVHAYEDGTEMESGFSDTKENTVTAVEPRLGCHFFSGANGEFCDCVVSEFTWWNVLLDAGERASLDDFADPRKIRPMNILTHISGVRDTIDTFGGVTVTTIGAPSVAAHPPVKRSAQILQFPPIAAGLGNLGLLTETDTTFALGKAKLKDIGLISETDLAQALVALKSRILSLLIETDIAQAIGKAKSRAVGLVSEADLAQAIGKAKALAISVITETDIAQPLGKAKSKIIGLINETDQVFAISTGGLSANLGLQTEADLALALDKAKIKLIGLASELDVAQPMSIVKRFNLGLALEVDSVFVMSIAKAKALGLVSESDIVFPITSPSAVVVINLVQRDARFQAKLRRDTKLQAKLRRDGTFAQTVPRDVKF